MSQTQLQGLCKATFPVAEPRDISHLTPLQGLCGPEGATGGGDGDIKHSAFFHLLHILKWM